MKNERHDSDLDATDARQAQIRRLQRQFEQSRDDCEQHARRCTVSDTTLHLQWKARSGAWDLAARCVANLADELEEATASLVGEDAEIAAWRAWQAQGKGVGEAGTPLTEDRERELRQMFSDGIDVARSYGDNAFYLWGEQLERQFQTALKRMRAGEGQCVQARAAVVQGETSK